VVIIRSLTLEGASKGLSFYLNPDFSKVTGRTVLEALGQAFFSLSLGMGTMLTYGSYLSKKDNLVSSGAYVALFDTGIALLAGLMIFPALFALGKAPDAGPKLVFVVLPELFQEMPLGPIVGIAFFLLLAIAALTSTISLLEVPVAYLVDNKRWQRKHAVWAAGALSLLLGIPSALSIFIGWVWGIDKAIEEIEQGCPSFRQYGTTWGLFIRYVCPAVIFIVLLNIVQVF